MRRSRIQTERLRRCGSLERSLGLGVWASEIEDRPEILSICQSKVEVRSIGIVAQSVRRTPCIGPVRWVYLPRFPIIWGYFHGLDQPIYQVDSLRGKSGIDSLRTPNRRPAVGTTLDPSPEKDERGGKSGLGTNRRLVSVWQFSKANRTSTTSSTRWGLAIGHCDSNPNRERPAERQFADCPAGRSSRLGSCTIFLLRPKQTCRSLWWRFGQTLTLVLRKISL